MSAINGSHQNSKEADLKRLDMIQMNVNEKDLLKQVLKNCNYYKDKKLVKVSSQPSMNGSVPSSPRINIEPIGTVSS